MDNDSIDEDSIDLEALQAQIDLSMSFTHNMVASWIKPFRKPPSRRGDIDADLKEYMRRPPRLGVGAPIPETHNLSREIARLKGRLSERKNKRSRDGDEGETEGKLEDDEEERRPGVVKKKTRVDPFGNNDWKKSKKNKQTTQEIAISEPPELPGLEEAEQAEVSRMVVDLSPVKGEVIVSLSAPTREKRNKRNPAIESPSNDIPSSLDRADTSSGIDVISAKPLTEETQKIVDISLTQTPVNSPSARRLAQSAALLKRPLLNLVSPPSEEGSEDETNGKTLEDGPKKKKKRKRRKRKKQRLPDLVVPDGSTPNILKVI